MTEKKTIQKKGLKVLIIEDEETLLEMYKTKFEKEGIDVSVAHDGEAGIAQAQTKAFDIVLIDIIMPKIDGFSVLEQLRALPAYKKTPLILLTNLGQEEDVERGKKLGATDYLVKANFTPSQVLEKIYSIVNKK